MFVVRTGSGLYLWVAKHKPPGGPRPRELVQLVHCATVWSMRGYARGAIREAAKAGLLGDDAWAEIVAVEILLGAAERVRIR